MYGLPIFNTADVVSEQATAATYEQLTSASSNWAPSVSDHRSFQVAQGTGQAFEPCRKQRGLVAVSREPTWNFQRHFFLLCSLSPRSISELREVC